MKFLAFLATLGLSAGCASVMLPRVGDDLSLAIAVQHGATVDASRGFPVAFYANPGQEPEYVDLEHSLGSTRLAAAQWVTELARQMNTAIAKVSLFDQRFSPISQQVFAYDVSNGDLTFAWREPSDGVPTEGIHVRVARMRLDGFKTSATSEGVRAVASIEVRLGDYHHVYACERAGDRWERAVFACLGEEILGDPALWHAAQSMP